MQSTFDWLKQKHFMCGGCSMCAAMSDENAESVRARGYSDGENVGSWVIDDNTSKARAREIFDGINDGDPSIMDSLPVLCLGEWADDPTFREILSEEGIECDEETEDDFWAIYSDAWCQGMTDRVTNDARKAMPMRVSLSVSDDDDGTVTVCCEDQEQARHDQSVSIDGQSSNWECPRDMDVAYASLLNCYDLKKALTDAGYEVDASEYSPPDDEDLAYWTYRNECENTGERALDREAWLATPSLPQTDATDPEKGSL